MYSLRKKNLLDPASFFFFDIMLLVAGSSLFGTPAKPTVGFATQQTAQSSTLFGQKPLFGSSTPTQTTSIFGTFSSFHFLFFRLKQFEVVDGENFFVHVLL